MFDRMRPTATRSQSIQMEVDYFGGSHGPPQCNTIVSVRKVYHRL